MAEGHTVRTRPCADILPHVGQSRQSSIREIIHLSDPHMTNITCLPIMAQSHFVLCLLATHPPCRAGTQFTPVSTLLREGARNYFQIREEQHNTWVQSTNAHPIKGILRKH